MEKTPEQACILTHQRAQPNIAHGNGHANTSTGQGTTAPNISQSPQGKESEATHSQLGADPSSHQ